AGATAWAGLPAYTTTNCSALDPNFSTPGNTISSKARITVAGSTPWEVYSVADNSGSHYEQAYAYSWNGAAWSGGAVGCFAAGCGATLRQMPQSLITVGGNPTLAAIEWDHSVDPVKGWLYISQRTTTWSAIGGTLNVNGSGSQVLEASLAGDGGATNL